TQMGVASPPDWGEACQRQRSNGHAAVALPGVIGGGARGTSHQEPGRPDRVGALLNGEGEYITSRTARVGSRRGS
ncbi:MAG: hypothetical protein ABR555_20170, partial [Pyrinomonadaceae bacterium]